MELKDALSRAQEVTHAQTELFFSEYLPHLTEVDPVLTGIGERLQEYCLRSGKAIRPLMTAAGVALSRGTSLEETLADPVVQKLMLAMELVHKRLLMADDVADRDERRHDKPAFHTLWRADLTQDQHYTRLSDAEREHIARSYTEIAGILLQRLSEQIIAQAELSPFERRNIDQILVEYVYEKTLAGWYLLFEQNFDELNDAVSEADFLRGLELVTGAYSFQAPLLAGSVLGAQSDTLRTTLLSFGSAAGTLHQLTDDVIGLFGDPSVTGKPVGGDIREGKKTLLIQYAYRLGDERDRQQLRKLLGKPDISESEVEVVREIVRRTGAFDQAEAKIAEYVRFGEEALSHLPAGEVSGLFRQLLHALAHRQK